MFKGFVSEGDSIHVRFQADRENSGSTGFFFGYVPKDGSSAEIDTHFEAVAPAGDLTVESAVPSAEDAWSMKIRIDVPEAEGSGRLVVTVAGDEQDNRVVSEDVTWTYSVNPSS